MRIDATLDCKQASAPARFGLAGADRRHAILSIVGTSDDYHELNSGPHRRGIVRLAPPALSWHLCFWVPFVANGPFHAIDVRRAQARNEVDRFVVELLRQLREQQDQLVVSGLSIGSIVGGKLILFNNVYDEASLDPFPGIRRAGNAGTPTTYDPPLNARQSDLFESAYRDILLSFAWKTSEVDIRVELNTEYFTLSVFVDLAKDNGKIVELHEVLRDGNEACLRAGRTKQQCTDALRDHLYSAFWDNFKATFLMSSNLAWVHGAESGPFGHAFADFRGLTVSCETKEFDTSGGSDWGKAAVGHFMPVLASKERYEIAANYMLDERALYMSTLGPQNPTQSVEERIPVFFLVYATPSVRRFEIGRLLLAIHLLGSLRLAALRRLKSLMEAGRILSHLEPLVQEARAHIAGEKSDAAMVKIEEANNLFNRVHELENAILYRIERSRYYVSQFQKTVPILAIKPIEGFQEYDSFVQRRMGAALDYIDRLGKRYERATTNLSLLQQYYLALKANKIAGGGEAVLFLVLMPYYLTALLHYLIGETAMPAAYLCALILIAYGGWKYFRPRLISTIAAVAILVALPWIVDGSDKRACFAQSFPQNARCYLSPPSLEPAAPETKPQGTEKR